jgi:UDP-2,4-diacetamido-2,4,6-trideoxy-beta-L-altropyranose hydrolase
MSSRKLLIRADANVEIGTGHVMRCLALAQAWQDRDGDVVFAMAQSSAGIDERLRREQAQISKLDVVPGSTDDAVRTARLTRDIQADWAIVDGYHFDSAYQRFLKDEGLKLLVIDDYGHAGHYSADVVVNQNISAKESLYASREKYTRLCLGLDYVLLRREFKAWQEWKREIAPVAKKILVTMGGSDPENITSAVLRAMRLVDIDGIELIVVVGPGNPNGEMLEGEAAGSNGLIRLCRNVTNIPELMSCADAAISAAGSTCWELCFLGLSAALIDVAENQRPIAEALGQDGAGIHLGSGHTLSGEEIRGRIRSLMLSPAARSYMSERARRLVDGRGAERVIAAMRGTHFTLRGATDGDCVLLWEWANDPDVRTASFEGNAISWQDHDHWFRAKLADKNCVILIAENNGVPLGQIRFDRTLDYEAEIDVSIARKYRGRGYASSLIATASERIFVDTDVRQLHAWIKAGNSASETAFERARFKRCEAAYVKGAPTVHYARIRAQDQPQ